MVSYNVHRFKMKPRKVSTKWAQIALSVGIFGIIGQLIAGGAPGALPPSISTNAPTTPPASGATGVNPVTGVPTLPLGGLTGGIGTLPPPIGISTNTPVIIPGITPPKIGPDGLPIEPPTSVLPPDGNANVSTNAEPVITPGMMREALRVFIRESKTIQREAQSGNSRQQHNLAVLYTLGIGVPLDFKRAHYWFNKAAQQGLPESQFNLAIAYQGGMGVRKDMVIAYKFYSLAATQGLPFASKGRDHIAQYMSRIQIETAQRMARGFQQGIERWQQMKDLEKAEQSNVNRILGIAPDPNNSRDNNGN